jgi:ABC-type dipeptide/oligopeptide/nickel transport system permease subunit
VTTTGALESSRRIASPDLNRARIKPSAGFAALAARRLRRDYLTLAALLLLIVYAGLAVGADVIASELVHTTPTKIDMRNTFSPPSPAHWLGTDDYGRDQLVRLLYGARVSLMIGVVAAVVNLSIGISLGAAAGYYGRRVDDVIVWVLSTVRAIPALFLLILVGALFRPGPEGLALLIGAISWPGVARVVRGQVLAVRQRDYILAARAVGASALRILPVHVWPNVVSITLVILGQDIGSVILSESALSYLGLGVQPPNASWGNMLSNAQRFLSNALWLVVTPGACIFSTVLALYLVADGLRDALDPRLK